MIRATRDAPAGISPSIVGTGVGPVSHDLDARWLMAYAAALGETDPRYFDTLDAKGPLAHPLFPVCYEWPAAVAIREATVARELQPFGVHATHHLVVHRSPRAGDTLVTSARVVAVQARRSGTLVVTRFDTTDADGQPVTTTDYGSIYRGVVLAGAPPSTSGSPGPPPISRPAPARVRWAEVVHVAGNAARVYTECARIWNPIHTDVAAAQRAGLSAPILHGTATLALAVSRVLTHDLDGAAARVREVRARFTGMVALPSSFTVRGWDDGAAIAFDAVGSDGTPVLSQGALIA